MSKVKKPIVLDETGQRIALALEAMSSGYGQSPASRVHSLTETRLMSDTVFEVSGFPEYVDDVSKYASFGIQDTGWYVFARIFAKDEVRVTPETTVEGVAGYIAVNGNGHVDVAVRFEVAAVAQIVVIDWGVYTDTFVFRATDLAIRNLDYRVTFYVYDADEFATWEYSPSGDVKYEDGKAYFALVDDEYVRISKTEYTIGDQIPGYYTQSFEYVLTEDSVFIEGKTYYTFDGSDYTEAEVVVGAPIPEDTYYLRNVVYTQATGYFADGVTYYVKGSDYTEAEVVVGAPIPVVYVHSNITFEGMTRNITYRFNDLIDCPTTFILPEIEDECHGAWFEIRLRHQGSYSMTLVPPTGDIKIATEHTQAESKGMNMVDLHYTSVDGAKVWRFMNTHSSFTADAPALASITLRALPETLAFTVGEAINLNGIEVVAAYEDGTTKLVTGSCTFSPANGTILTAEDAQVTATYIEGKDESAIEVTASFEITVSPAEEEEG